MQRLLRNERAMLIWMLNIESCTFGIKAKVKSSTMYGHVERSDKWINKCTHLKIYGSKGRGRPRNTLSATVTEDLKAWNIDANNVHDRPVWKKALRTAMKSPTRRNRGQVAQNG